MASKRVWFPEAPAAVPFSRRAQQAIGYGIAGASTPVVPGTSLVKRIWLLNTPTGSLDIYQKTQILFGYSFTALDIRDSLYLKRYLWDTEGISA